MSNVALMLQISRFGTILIHFLTVTFALVVVDELKKLDQEAKNEQEMMRQQQIKYQEHVDEYERLQAELKALSEEQSQLPSKLNDLKMRQNELTNALRRKQLALEHSSSVFESRLKAVQLETALYRDVLGLSVRVK